MSNSTMTAQDFQTTISANVSIAEAIAKVNRVADWWGTNVKGSAEKLHDEFTIRFGTTWVAFKVTEVEADKKRTWAVTDCFLPWLSDKTEWTGTELVWEFSRKGNSTEVHFTHVGLVPEAECYTTCHKGWSDHIDHSLLKLLTENQGLPKGG